MIVFLNSSACGGSGVNRWATISGALHANSDSFTVRATSCIAELRLALLEAWQTGERHFIAAGGDGTVNALADAFMTLLSAQDRAQASLGAIGLGSSNDFHKPFGNRPTVHGIPLMIDPLSARPRDVGVLSLPRRGKIERRFFLINASAGITAAANRHFNNGGPFMRGLKRLWTGGAIMDATLKAIFQFDDFVARLSRNGSEDNILLTNLAVLKSPHVSGSLRFPVDVRPDSGMFSFQLATALPVPERIRLLLALARGKLWHDARLQSWAGSGAVLRSDSPFDVEYDGEVVRTSEARFSILPGALRVCTC